MNLVNTVATIQNKIVIINSKKKKNKRKEVKKNKTHSHMQKAYEQYVCKSSFNNHCSYHRIWDLLYQN